MLNGKLVCLVPYTRERCHALFRVYEADGMMTETPFLYDEQRIDAYFAAKTSDSARHIFAIEHQGAVIGELQLKGIDTENKTCTLSIILANDAVKNKGFGTEAEKLAIGYAFGVYTGVTQGNLPAALNAFVALLLYAVPAVGLLKLKRWARMFELILSFLFVIIGFLIMFGYNMTMGVMTIVPHGLIGMYLLSEDCRRTFGLMRKTD